MALLAESARTSPRAEFCARVERALVTWNLTEDFITPMFSEVPDTEQTRTMKAALAKALEHVVAGRRTDALAALTMVPQPQRERSVAQLESGRDDEIKMVRLYTQPLVAAIYGTSPA
jgi:hypothetical protein